MSNQSFKYTFEYNGAKLPLLINSDDTKISIIDRLQKRWKVLKHQDLIVDKLVIDGEVLTDQVSSWPKKSIQIISAASTNSSERITNPEAEDSEDSDIFVVKESSTPATLSRVNSVSSAMNLLIETADDVVVEEELIEEIPPINKKVVATKSNAFMKLVKKQTPKKTGPVLPVLKREDIKKELTKTQGDFGYSLKQFKSISGVFEKQGATLQ